MFLPCCDDELTLIVDAAECLLQQTNCWNYILALTQTHIRIRVTMLTMLIYTYTCNIAWKFLNVSFVVVVVFRFSLFVLRFSSTKYLFVCCGAVMLLCKWCALLSLPHWISHTGTRVHWSENATRRNIICSHNIQIHFVFVFFFSISIAFILFLFNTVSLSRIAFGCNSFFILVGWHIFILTLA